MLFNAVDINNVHNVNNYEKSLPSYLFIISPLNQSNTRPIYIKPTIHMVRKFFRKATIWLLRSGAIHRLSIVFVGIISFICCLALVLLDEEKQVYATLSKPVVIILKNGTGQWVLAISISVSLQMLSTHLVSNMLNRWEKHLIDAETANAPKHTFVTRLKENHQPSSKSSIPRRWDYKNLMYIRHQFIQSNKYLSFSKF